MYSGQRQVMGRWSKGQNKGNAKHMEFSNLFLI